MSMTWHCVCCEGCVPRSEQGTITYDLGDLWSCTYTFSKSYNAPQPAKSGQSMVRSIPEVVPFKLLISVPLTMPSRVHMSRACPVMFFRGAPAVVLSTHVAGRLEH